MYLTATDTNMTIESNIPVDSEGDVSFVIEEKNFANIVNKLPEEEILMDYNHEKNQIKINSGKSSSTFNCFSADEFPRFNIGEGQKIILSKKDIKNLIRKTSFSASADELNGCLLYTSISKSLYLSIYKFFLRDILRISLIRN